MSLTDTFPRGIRGASAADLLGVLDIQSAHRRDWVAPISKITSRDGRIIVAGALEPTITEDGVTPGDADLEPTFSFDGQLATAAGIPVQYLRKMRETSTLENDPALSRLLDANVNTWFARLAARDPGRKVLVRAFADDSGQGLARGLLSSAYGAVDNLELFGAVIRGVADAGLDPSELQVDGDLTDTNMYVRIVHPGITVPATEFLKGYGYQGRSAQQYPGICAGLILRNSETGHGAASVAPRFLVKVCTNGLVVAKDAKRIVHLGARLEEGAIAWSANTQRRTLDLATSMTTDAVTTFMTEEYMERAVTEIMELAATPVPNAEQLVTELAKGRWAEQEAKAILAQFFRGGQETAGGLGQAVTAYAHDVDADRAHELESSYFDVVTAAAKTAAKIAA